MSGMLLSGAACGDTRNADDAGSARVDSSLPSSSTASSTPPAAPAANSGAATSDAGSVTSTPPPALDAGATCRTASSLADYCAWETCPPKLSQAIAYLCRTPDAPHELVDNTCSGKSALHHSAEGEARYDFAEGGELVGVTLLGVAKTCGANEVTFGQACAVAGTPESFCGKGCGFIACLAGVSISVDAPNPRDFQGARVNFCHNQQCTNGTFAATIEAASGNREIVYTESLPDAAYITFMLSMDRPTPWLFISYEAREQNLQNGDHYLIEVTHPDGRVLYKLDHAIDYERRMVSELCTLSCKGKNIDTRSPLPDGADDAGAP
jgi:hypothetical protein